MPCLAMECFRINIFIHFLKTIGKENGKKAYAEDAIVIELEGGKIKYWREYIDRICCKIEVQ